jgi:outer membrane lipoprotein-sorting protein
MLLLLLLLVGGCARPIAPTLPLPAAEDLLRRLALGGETYRTLDAEARVGVSVAGKYVSTQQFLLLEKPDRFRTDVLSSFGQLILQLAVDRDDLSVFLNTEVPGRFYRGAASDDNLQRFTRLPVRFRDLVRLLLYDPPRIAGENLQVSRHEQGVRLEISAAQRRQEIIFDRTLRPVECRYYRQDDLWLRAVYEKFSAQDGFPQKIRIEVPGQNTSATVHFSQVRTNTQLPAQRFVVQPPANALRESLPH